MTPRSTSRRRVHFAGIAHPDAPTRYGLGRCGVDILLYHLWPVAESR